MLTWRLQVLWLKPKAPPSSRTQPALEKHEVDKLLMLPAWFPACLLIWGLQALGLKPRPLLVAAGSLRLKSYLG
jgi:hypothetical protein